MSCSNNWHTLFLVASLFLWQTCLCDDGVYAWRKGASVVVMNEQLFIHGGISSKPKRLWSDGWAIENQTFAIPLGRSWVKSEIDMAQFANENAMYKNISADNPSMWTKDDKQIIFWGGAGSFGRANLAATSPRPWTYTPSGSSGQYGTVEQAASQRPTDKTTQDPLYRTGGGSWTQCNGLGFYMGGFIGSATDGGFPHRLNGTGQRALTGLLIYDIAGGTWRNRTTQGSGFGGGRMEGTHVSGQAVCLPTLGKDGKGIVLFLAGYHGTWENRFTREFVRTDQITFYDIGSDTFHTQRTTGTAPKQREQPCAVAAKAKNSNTYEVVLFGGSGATPADTYILAVPGFEWFPVAPVAGGMSLADEGRRDHACAVVGKGGRQMLAVGGSEAKDSVNDVWKRRDPWGDNSMHIFDMTDLKWKPDYAHDAADYQQPAMVRSWYKKLRPQERHME
ncbi:hypothetical protein MAPG_08424 [Magnaporthiopsis poae ATCC 64411]|uniref:Kelch repeat protein n=1 Tax=Magnaporthiopsis poae (strain ATCC 64411 / 73-15) TaxID=644358 RepID=A0A0C4E7B6_MAGP6|nr:hypothetical protein MAPG_08424 [Magnaporthiopsis poae ATCC 64411]